MTTFFYVRYNLTYNNDLLLTTSCSNKFSTTTYFMFPPLLGFAHPPPPGGRKKLEKNFVLLFPSSALPGIFPRKGGRGLLSFIKGVARANTLVKIL